MRLATHAQGHTGWVYSWLGIVIFPCLRNLDRTRNLRSLGPWLPLVCKQLGDFAPLHVNLLKTSVLPSPYPVPGACQEQTDSLADTSLPSVTAGGSSMRAAETPSSGIQTGAPSSAAQTLTLVLSSVALARGRFPGPSTEHHLVPSHPSSESTAMSELG